MKTNKHVATLISHGSETLSMLSQKVAQLDKLTTLLKNNLNNPLRQHCQVANLRDDCLVIMTDGSAWATQLRYLTPDLLKQLQREPEFRHIRTLHCYIEPISTASTPYHAIQREPLSKQNIQLLKAVGNTCDDELGRALKKLAEHAVAYVADTGMGTEAGCK